MLDRVAWVRDAIGFFFQAEDGIRDHCVTGVQTCALPILKPGAPAKCPSPKGGGEPRKGHNRKGNGNARRPVVNAEDLVGDRSEERRVGKEGRSRWSPNQSENNADDTPRVEAVA